MRNCWRVRATWIAATAVPSANKASGFGCTAPPRTVCSAQTLNRPSLQVRRESSAQPSSQGSHPQPLSQKGPSSQLAS